MQALMTVLVSVPRRTRAVSKRRWKLVLVSGELQLSGSTIPRPDSSLVRGEAAPLKLEYGPLFPVIRSDHCRPSWENHALSHDAEFSVGKSQRTLPRSGSINQSSLQTPDDFMIHPKQGSVRRGSGFQPEGWFISLWPSGFHRPASSVLSSSPQAASPLRVRAMSGGYLSGPLRIVAQAQGYPGDVSPSDSSRQERFHACPPVLTCWNLDSLTPYTVLVPYCTESSVFRAGVRVGCREPGNKDTKFG